MAHLLCDNRRESIYSDPFVHAFTALQKDMQGMDNSGYLWAMGKGYKGDITVYLFRLLIFLTCDVYSELVKNFFSF